jgi:hypothetical protein
MLSLSSNLRHNLIGDVEVGVDFLHVVGFEGVYEAKGLAGGRWSVFRSKITMPPVTVQVFDVHKQLRILVDSR